jgi:hypothetical protein
VTGLPSIGELLARGDLDELVRAADELASRGSWDELLVLRDGCRSAAEEIGKQLWGVAHYADYRIALDAPAALAGAVVQSGSGRFTLGPLTEVVAQHHTFDELAPYLDSTVVAHVAQERVLRGEDLRADPRVRLDDLGLPASLQPFEPLYPLPTYRPAERLDGEPPVGAGGQRPAGSSAYVDVGDAAPAVPAGVRQDTPGRVAGTLNALVAPWRDESTGVVRSASADDLATAVRAVGGAPDPRVRLDVPEVLAAMAFAAASGGVHGRRRGGSAGRSAAWWVAVTATGAPFPPDVDGLEFGLEELTWWTFPAADPAPAGWQLRLAVAGGGWAAAVAAYDSGDDRTADGRP